MKVTQSMDVGVLIVSVDLEPGMEQTRADQPRRLVEVIDWLIATFNRLGMRATWAAADPVHSAATERLLASGVGHEMALSGDAGWVGPRAGRARFAQELTRRLYGSRAAGIPVTSLVPRNVEPEAHVDLLVKHGVTAVRGGTTDRRSRRSWRPRPVRFGLWEMPVAARVPGGRGWTAGYRPGLGIRRGLRRAVRQRSLHHLAVDAWQMAAIGERERRSLDVTLRAADRLRERRVLRIVTLAEMAAELSAVPYTTPARSILRPAG